MILVVDFTGAYSGSQEDITINNLGLNRNKKLKDKCSGTAVRGNIVVLIYLLLSLI